MSDSMPDYILDNLAKDKSHYSLYNMVNITRCKTDTLFLGDVLIANEDLIWHSIYKYIGNPDVVALVNNLDKDDILQLARIGFIKAINNFDVTRGLKFSSYAVTAIVREVKGFIRDNSGVIKLTRGAFTTLNRIRKLEDGLGTLPPPAEIASILGVSELKVQSVLKLRKPLTSLDDSGTDTDILSLLNTATKSMTCSNNVEGVSDEAINKAYIKNIVKCVSFKISDTELNILIDQLGGLTQTQIANKYAISQMKVNRTLKKIALIISRSRDFTR